MARAVQSSNVTGDVVHSILQKYCSADAKSRAITKRVLVEYNALRSKHSCDHETCRAWAPVLSRLLKINGSHSFRQKTLEDGIRKFDMDLGGQLSNMDLKEVKEGGPGANVERQACRLKRLRD